MRVPTITHLQFVVLDTLDRHDRFGQEIRNTLAAVGAKREGPAFYQFMGRMEDAKLIASRKEYKSRRYTLRSKGIIALGVARDFYRTLLG